MGKRCSSNVLKPGGPWPVETWRVLSGGASTGTGRPAASSLRTSLSPEQAAAERLDAERVVLAAERARLEQVASFLSSCAQKLTAAREEVLQDTQKDLVSLVLKIAAQVIHEEVTQRPEAITSQVAAALTRIKEDGVITVRVHPLVLDLLKEAAPKLLDSLGQGSRLRFEPDAAIVPGGCLIESPQQIIDARIDTQLGRLGAALTKQITEPS